MQFIGPGLVIVCLITLVCLFALVVYFIIEVPKDLDRIATALEVIAGIDSDDEEVDE